MKRFLAVFVVLTTGMATVLAVAPADAVTQTPPVATGASTAAAAPSVTSTAGGFVSLVSTRLLDTRSGNGAPKAAVAGGHTVAVRVSGRAGVPWSGVSAVVLNVTVVAPARAGFVTVFGGGAARPAVSNLNFVRGQVVPNLVVAPVGADGKVDLYNGSPGSVQMLADVSGWFRTKTAPPGSVTGVSAIARNTSVVLRWVNPVSGSLTGVMIRRSVGSVAPGSASAGSLVADVAKPTVVFTNTGLASSTKYSYALFAHDTQPAFAKAATVSVSTTTPPGPVTGVSATAKHASVVLRWVNPVSASLTGVMIRRAVGATPPASASTGTLVADVAKPTVVFTDSGLTSSTKYSYAFFAHDAEPAFAAKATLSVTTTAPPGSVTGVTATAANTAITLRWVNPVGSSLTGVMIRRAVGSVAPASPSAGSLVADVAKPTVVFTDSGLSSGTQYSYAFFAHDAEPAFAPGVTVSITTTAPPGPVAGVTATAANTAITLRWVNPVGSSLTGVMIRRAVGPIAPAGPSAGSLVADVAKPTVVFTDSGLSSGTQYSYAFFAHDAAPTFAAAVTVTVSTTTPPGPVTGVTATAADTSVTLRWVNPVSGSLSGVMIRRSVGSQLPATPTSGSFVADVTKPTVAFTQTGMDSGTKYSYALFAHDAEPTYSTGATVTVTTTGPAATVTGVTATAANTAVALAWVNPVSASLTGVMIRRAAGAVAPASASAGTLVADVAKPTAVFTDTGLTSNTQYSYALFAHDAVPAYAASATVTVSTTGPPGPVTGVSATAGSSSVALAWVNPVSATLTGVMIRRAAGAVAPASVSAGTLVADVAKSALVFTDSGLASGTQYSYALFAHDGVPSYAPAAAVTVTTTDGTVASIAGTVTDAGGTHHGLEAVGVDVVSTSTGNGVSTSTLSDGTWSVIGLAAGTYSVCFDGSDADGGSSDVFGYVDQCYKNQPTVNTSTPVTVIAGATRTGVNAALAGASH